MYGSEKEKLDKRPFRLRGGGEKQAAPVGRPVGAQRHAGAGALLLYVPAHLPDAGTATAALAVKWCLLALAAYAAKVVLFGLSTGTSHAMAYTILDEATASFFYTQLCA